MNAALSRITHIDKLRIEIESVAWRVAILIMYDHFLLLVTDKAREAEGRPLSEIMVSRECRTATAAYQASPLPVNHEVRHRVESWGTEREIN